MLTKGFFATQAIFVLSTTTRLALGRWKTSSAQDALMHHANGTEELEEATDIDDRHGRNVLTLKNVDNAMYVLDVSLGGQTITALPDTGSFDFVVFSADCSECSAPNAYQSSKSSQFSTTHFELSQYYGSGAATSLECRDDFGFGDTKIPQQSFWKVTSADFGFWGVDFDSILGLGPPASSVIIDQVILTQMVENLHLMLARGEDATGYNRTVQSYKEAVEHAKSRKTFLAESVTQRFSICLGPGNGDEGVFIWNDKMDWRNPSVFTTINSEGSMYWSAPIRNVRLGDGTKLGCNGDDADVDTLRCVVMVDSGTSLLVVPKSSYLTMRKTVDVMGTGCELNSFPSFNFEMGGETFSLPPEAYMGFLSGEMSEGLRAAMPHAYDRQKMGLNTSCSIIAMTTSDGDDGPGWILGLPFFRKYYSSFVLDAKCEHGRRMHFAEKDGSCNPVGRSELKQTVPSMNFDRVVTIDAKKIRVPRKARHFAPKVLRDPAEK